MSRAPTPRHVSQCLLLYMLRKVLAMAAVHSHLQLSTGAETFRQPPSAAMARRQIGQRLRKLALRLQAESAGVAGEARDPQTRRAVQELLHVGVASLVFCPGRGFRRVCLEVYERAATGASQQSSVR